MNSPAEPPVYSVTELNELVNATLTQSVGTVLVEGEVSGYTVRQGKWVSFDLKDGTSTLNCFAVLHRIGLPIEEGMRVRILGTPRIYVPYGKYSFNVLAIEPVGTGALRRAYELLLAKLNAEGLFAPEHKRPIPAFPVSIGLITSPDGAALGDVRRILRERWGGFRLILAPVTVQGRTAAAAVVDAIEHFNRHDPVSTLIVTRGGGSLEDLQAFNDERVARAIYASRIPIIAAIGHEQDVTIAELVADTRAATPSNAAQLAVPDQQTVALRISESTHRSRNAVANRIEGHRALIQRAGRAFDRLVRSAQEALTKRRIHLTNEINIKYRMVDAAARHLATQTRHARSIVTQRLDVSGTQLTQRRQLIQAFNPKDVLGRGYSFTVDTNSGSIIRSVRSIAHGQRITTTVSDGAFQAEVE